MADGYWTPWHIAQAQIDQLRAELRECQSLLESSLASDTQANVVTLQRPTVGWILARIRDVLRSAPETNDARDAARYRWLRNADPMLANPELFPTLDGTALDDGIDAAMALTAPKATAHQKNIAAFKALDEASEKTSPEHHREMSGDYPQKTRDCLACSVGNPGVYVKDGVMYCPHRPESPRTKSHE